MQPLGRVPWRCPATLMPAAITSDPANVIAVRLFGEEATNKLLKMATGHPSVAS